MFFHLIIHVFPQYKSVHSIFHLDLMKFVMFFKHMRKIFCLVFIVAVPIARGDETRLNDEDCQSFSQVFKNIKALANRYKFAVECKTFSNCSGL